MGKIAPNLILSDCSPINIRGLFLCPEISLSEDNTQGIERHMQTFIGVLLMGLVGWTGNSVTQSRESIARMDERFVSMSRDMRELKSRVGDGYEVRLEFIKQFQSIQNCRDDIESINNHIKELHGHK